MTNAFCIVHNMWDSEWITSDKRSIVSRTHYTSHITYIYTHLLPMDFNSLPHRRRARARASTIKAEDSCLTKRLIQGATFITGSEDVVCLLAFLSSSPIHELVGSPESRESAFFLLFAEMKQCGEQVGERESESALLVEIKINFNKMFVRACARDTCHTCDWIIVLNLCDTIWLIFLPISLYISCRMISN